MTSRAGFTLIELLVALVLVAIGVLATVAASAVIVREQDDGHTMALAAEVAVNRLEWLRSHGCSQEAGSAAGAKGVSEWWASTTAFAGVRSLSDSVAFATGGTQRLFVLRAEAWC